MTSETAGNNPLHEYARNQHSQAGEDGVIAEIFRRIEPRSKWCVEFGAWDGLVLSNTRALLTRGWSGVLIEGDERRAQRLAKLYGDRRDVFTQCAFVGWDGENDLDQILSRTPIPEKFDLLIIDIDGNDYHVWESVSKYRPRVVVVEFNPTIPNGIDFVQAPDPRRAQGASIDALVRLARSKGYELAAALEFNAFFVSSEEFHLIGLTDNSIPNLRRDSSWQTQIFFGFDGTAFLRGKKGLYWHGVPMPERIHVIPRVLEGHPGQFGLFRHVMHVAWRVWKVLGAWTRRRLI